MAPGERKFAVVIILELVFSIMIVVLKITLHTFNGIVRGHTKFSPGYIDYMRNLLVYHATKTFSVAQLQLILPSVPSIYKFYCGLERTKPRIDFIPSPPTPTAFLPGCWLGDPSTARKIMIYFHGGGFVMPGVLPHFQFLSRLISWSSGNLAVLVVAYSLVPSATYPTQLAECVEALRHVLHAHNRTPSEVLIAGDSAGANLVFALLSQLAHAHPRSDIIRPLALRGGKLGGALAIGPWISADTSGLTPAHGAPHVDIVKPSVAVEFMEAYRDGADEDAYILAATATADWWTGVANTVEHVLVTAGSDELLLESIVKLVHAYERGGGEEKITLVVGEGEIHDEPVWPKGDKMLDALGPDKCQEAAVRAWIKRLVC